MRLTAAGPVAGLRHVLHAFTLLRAPGVRVYVLVPLAINVALFTAALAGIGTAFDYVIGRYLGAWPEWIQWLLWLLFGLLAVLVVFFTFSVVANLVASPFNGLLAEAVERHLRPELGQMVFSWRALAREVGRSVVAELRKLGYIAVRALPLLVFSFIPGINVVAPALWLLFGAWMLCLEYLDCPLGNHGQVFPRVLEEMRARRGLALGFGFGMTVMTVIPLLNFLAVPVGVAGATSLYCAHVARA